MVINSACCNEMFIRNVHTYEVSADGYLSSLAIEREFF